MPARLVQVTIRNNTSFPLRWISDSDSYTTWQDPWFPSKLNGLAPGKQASFRSESDGIFTGTHGEAVFEVGRIPNAQIAGPADELTITWNLPYIDLDGRPDCSATIVRRGTAAPSAAAVVIGMRSMEGESKQEFGWEALGATTPFTLPLVWASEVSLNSVEFLIEVHDTTAVNLFPSNTPEPKANPADAFHFLAQHLDGAVGGFPNFVDHKQGPNYLRGGVTLTPQGAEWRDVPLSQLGTPQFEREDDTILVDRPNRFDRPKLGDTNVLIDRPAVVGTQKLVQRPGDVSQPAVITRPRLDQTVSETIDPSRLHVDQPIVSPSDAPEGPHQTAGFTRFINQPSLDDFAARMRASNDYAGRHGFLSGFPTFFHADYGKGVVCGTVLIRREAGEWRDVPLSELGVALDDIPGRFRATQQWASARGFIGGFPNFFHADHGQGIVCGTILLKAGTAKRVEILAGQDPR